MKKTLAKKSASKPTAPWSLRVPYRVKIAATMGVALLIVLSFTSYTLYRLASKRIIEEFGQKLITVVVNGAQQIDGDSFAKMTKPSQMKSKPYLKVQTLLRHLTAVNNHIHLRYFYTMAPTDKPGTWRYVVDAASNSSKDFSPLGSTEDLSYDRRWLKQPNKPMAEGNFDYRVPVTQNDEVGDLSKAFNQMAKGLKERELYRQQFGRYVSRQIAEKILAQPDKAFWDAERKRVTILFSDIRGFTAMSEKVAPEVIVARLNEYLTLMIDIVFQHEGTLDKFIGDAVMALFGAPVSLGNDEERAVRVAVDMQKAVKDLSWRWSKQGLPEFKIGIGINTGNIVVGNIGSEKRMEYSAIGDAVNLASRLESLNKDYQTGILISEETYKAVRKITETRFVDNVTVKGRTQPVAVYEVLGIR